MKIINLEQGSDEWKAFRRGKIGASDSSAIRGESPWDTPYSWWTKAMNCTDTPDNYAMAKGRALEPVAREIFNRDFSCDVKPAVVQHDFYEWMIASLDGISPDGRIILEIKCGGKELHERNKAGNIPTYYWIQVQKQIGISNPEIAFFMTYFEGDYHVSTVERDEDFIKEMFAFEADFHEKHLVRKEPPALSDRDYDQVEDAEGSQLLKEYQSLTAEEKEVKKTMDELKKRKDAIKEKVSSLGSGRNFILDGIKVYQKSLTSYDIDRMREDGIDVDSYQKSSKPWWEIGRPPSQKSA